MKKLVKAACLLLGASTLSGQALAEKDFAPGFYVAPGINVLDVKEIYDSNLGMDRKAGLDFSLGYQFDNPWAVELMYQYTKPKRTGSNNDFKVSYLHLDGLYTMAMFKSPKLAPYLVAGIGSMAYDTKGFKESDETFNAGVGIKYALTRNFHIRLDGRGTIGFHHGDLGANANLALAYVFGGKQTDKPAKPVTEKVSQAPVEIKKPEDSTSIAAVIVDSDGDGVPDHLDECANTAPGAKVDEKGCYILLTENHEFTLNVTFAIGSSVINQDSTGDIRDLAQFLTEYPNTQVSIEGHSDNTGSVALNKRLSQQRADAVKQSLIDDFGINEARVSSTGYGMENPIADNSTAEGRAKNRRVVAQVSAQVTKIQED